MKYRFFILFVVFFSLYESFSQSICQNIDKTQKLLNQKHVNSFTFSEPIAHEILNLYIDLIYKQELIFSKEDSVFLHQKIQSKKNLCEVFESVKPIIISKIQKHDSLINSLKLDYFKNNQLIEKYVFSEETTRENDAVSLEKRAKKYYKYLFLKKCYQLEQAQVEVDEQKIMTSFLKKQSTFFKELLTDDYQLYLFINAICLRVDPHSAFFESSQKDEWMTHLSREQLSFGFELELTDDDLLEISEILPGGAAWNSQQLEEGDVIEQIELSTGKKYLSGIDSAEDIYLAIQNSENQTITFYVTKSEGTHQKVSLTKQVTEVSENVINGYIFTVNKQKIGYIYLPSFYSANPDIGTNGCASDLAREILRLKKDSISGLIIDVRGNGGGYVHEALNIAGLFINEGVLALSQEKGQAKPHYWKDPNRGTVYDGKLMVLVNNFSASASELLAGTLQQYNRAIIVGNSTYGKGTMQQIFPLDSVAETKQQNTHYVKITIGKFYMINKKTHQGIGIQPDIYLPSLYDFIYAQREGTSLYHIPADSITRNPMVTLFPTIHLQKLKTQSAQRVDNSTWKKNLKNLADSVNHIKGNKEIVLNKKSVFEWEKHKSIVYKRYQEHQLMNFTAYPIANTSIYNEFLGKQELLQKPNQLKIKELQKDLRLYEALNILSDYINQN